MLHAFSARAPGAARRLAITRSCSRTGRLLRRFTPAAGALHSLLCASSLLLAGGALRAEGKPAPAAASSQPAPEDAGSEIHIDTLEEGTSSRRVRRAAQAELPLDKLTRPQREAADVVLNNISLYRRLPVVRFEADPRVLAHFLDYPEVAVAIWRAMGISSLTMNPTAPGQYESDSGDGSVGRITVLYKDVKQQLIHCDGLFKSPVVTKPIKARALMHLQSEPANINGRELTTCRADVYVSFPSTAVETVARVASPVSNRIADRNFEEVAMFIRMMHVAMTRQPGWVEEITRRMDVSDARKDGMLDLMARVYVDASRKSFAAQQQLLTPEDLRLPTRREPETASGVIPAQGTQPAHTAARPGSTVK